MFAGEDAQLPFTQPVSVRNYLLWYSGLLYHTQFLQVLVLHSLRRFSQRTLNFTPPEEFPRMARIPAYSCVLTAPRHSSQAWLPGRD